MQGEVLRKVSNYDSDVRTGIISRVDRLKCPECEHVINFCKISQEENL